jgi:2-haloalkanoic acid dehalogenase type II
MSGRLFDLITFDCYGTLIDWERGIADAFRSAAARDGLSLDRNEILAAYADNEHLVESEPYVSYEDVLRRTAVRVADRLGWSLDLERARFLPESLPSWTPFVDTNPALERLAGAGIRLGLLSNTDDDLLAETRKQFTVPFDLIVTAQQVHSYKPDPGHFVTARSRIGSTPWLHAAESNFHDIVPANRLRIPNAWINRKGESARDGGVPTRELRDLTGLADWLV